MHFIINSINLDESIFENLNLITKLFYYIILSTIMNIFYLEWNQKKPTICEFRNTIPDNYNFHCEIKLRNLIPIFDTISLYGLINENHYEYEFNYSPYTKKSYLISHLQKSIRKMKHTKSVLTAKHLIDLDIQTLLRRLPIIMFEDVIPHTSLPIILWLMIAISKGFKIKSVMIQWLLGVVYFLSKCDKHDKVYKINSPNLNIINDNIYLKSILLRTAYGGMKGDMEMLNYFIQFWSDKFKKGETMDHSKIQYINHNLDSLPRSDWDLCANDFHCNRQLIQKVKQQYQLYSEKYIQKLIWEHSSRENKRIQFNINQEEYKDWLIIKKFVRFQQLNMEYF
tara:strand:- start:24 stop:1040 length:1017 start_codon:yes stop_codon:yes gene_type:complete